MENTRDWWEPAELGPKDWLSWVEEERGRWLGVLSMTDLVLGGSSNDGEEGRWGDSVPCFGSFIAAGSGSPYVVVCGILSVRGVGCGLVGTGFAVVMGARWDWTTEMVSLQFRLL